MTTAQDQQSRAEFIKHVLAPNGIYERGIGWVAINSAGEFQVPETLERWVDWQAAWQAARALPAGMEPAGEVTGCTSAGGGLNNSISRALPQGTKLYTAAQVLAMGRVPPGCVAVNAGALQMVVNALRRDADDGKTVRGEMADELIAATQWPQAAQEGA